VALFGANWTPVSNLLIAIIVVAGFNSGQKKDANFDQKT
jgi:hypothetical protein